MHPLRALGAFLCLAPLAPASLDTADYRAAVALYAQHQPLEAQHAFEALAAAHPDDADIQFYLGRLALQRDDDRQAVTCLEKAVALAPHDSRMHQRLGDAYGRAAEKGSSLALARKCKAAYERAVALDGKNLDARQSLMGFYQQAPWFAGGGMAKAHEQAEEIRKLDANRGRLAVAGLYVIERKYDLAFAEFETALKSNPDDYAALFQTGRLAALSGQRLDEGIAALQRCLAMPPPENQPPAAAAHWRLGNILEKKGDKPAARAAYEAALKLDPKFIQAIDALKKLN